jgi:hypothetical protein
MINDMAAMPIRGMDDNSVVQVRAGRRSAW